MGIKYTQSIRKSIKRDAVQRVQHIKLDVTKISRGIRIITGPVNTNKPEEMHAALDRATKHREGRLKDNILVLMRVENPDGNAAALS